jgi:glycosyltransferase involved in cell wall biosynthesis
MLHDVAIYAPFAAGQYNRAGKRGGGAERQTHLLARALSEQGIRVAHIVYEVEDPLPLPSPNLALVERREFSGLRRFGKFHEAVRIWRGLNAADAAVYIFRTGSPALGVVAVFCRLRRRRLIFASSTDADFTLVGLKARIRSSMYRLGLHYTDAVVVQTAEQLRLVREGFPRLTRSSHIPSFAEPMPAAERPGTSFIWIGRTVDYKQPLRYAELACAVPDAQFRMVATPIRDAMDLHAQLLRAAADVPNLEILDPRPHGELMRLVGEAVAVVSTSRLEGMPNIFLEGWASGIPVLTLDVDPDDVIGRRGIGVAAGGSWDEFVAGARRLWDSREDHEDSARASRAYIDDVHSLAAVGSRWVQVVSDVRGQ